MTYDVTATQYKNEWITLFQRGETYLKDTVMRETILAGHSSATFAFAGVSSDMTERGVNGLIPAANATDTQINVPLKEKHFLEKETDFNVFTSQGEGLRKAMQMRARTSAAREIDNEIVRALTAASNVYNSGTAVTLTHGKIVDIISELRENDVHGMVTFVHSVKSFARLKTLQQFTSVDYVDQKPLMGDDERPVMFAGARHVQFNGLVGKGGATAALYVYAKDAVGHALANESTDVKSGFDDEQAYSWARSTIYHGAKILQQAGVLKVVHDDTAAFA